jgi:hypothetical protein
MRTFSESLTITKNFNLIKEAFKLMILNRIHPMNFVEWYTTDGVIYQGNGRLNESMAAWTEEQTNSQQMYDYIKKGAIGGALAGGAIVPVGGALPGMAIGGLAGLGAYGLGKFDKWMTGDKKAPPAEAGHPLAKATKELEASLSELSKRYNSSAEMKKKITDPEFQKTLMLLINALKFNLEQPAAAPEANPPANAPNPPQPAKVDPMANLTQKPDYKTDPMGALTYYQRRQAMGLKDHYNPYLNRNNYRLKESIRKSLKDLARMGYSPEAVFESYIKTLESRFDESLGNWFGQLGANLSGWMGGKGWGSGAKQYDGNQDDIAIQNVSQKLDVLERQLKDSKIQPHPEFLKHSESLRRHLGMSGTAAAQPAQAKEDYWNTKRYNHPSANAAQKQGGQLVAQGGQQGGQLVQRNNMQNPQLGEKDILDAEFTVKDTKRLGNNQQQQLLGNNQQQQLLGNNQQQKLLGTNQQQQQIGSNQQQQAPLLLGYNPNVGSPPEQTSPQKKKRTRTPEQKQRRRQQDQLRRQNPATGINPVKPADAGSQVSMYGNTDARQMPSGQFQTSFPARENTSRKIKAQKDFMESIFGKTNNNKRNSWFS